ncbi:hypothetical protein IFM89_012962 [Coptis chinensis]|uniref:Uncharacterized protein n=1 Tax=Coptis chinensis TaxID=261450 RepID=A0A835LZC5_9MAGN|nr:hypothetical protein IFM89_012962 [Coptis chinensis]
MVRSQERMCLWPHIQDEIKRLVSLDPYLGEKDLDNNPVAKVISRDGKGRVRGLGTGVTKTVVHASAPYIKIVEEEKRKHESTVENVKLVRQHLDEETRARKILEKKLECYAPEFENTSPQVRRQSGVLDEVSHVPPSTRCLLKNFRKITVALGSVSNDVPSADSYNITIDDIFDYTIELYVGKGTFGDISIGDTIKWPMPFVEPI